MVVHVAAVLSELSEFSTAVFALPIQVLLHSALLSMSGLLHMPPEQSLLKELLPTHITPERGHKDGLRYSTGINDLKLRLNL